MTKEYYECTQQAWDNMNPNFKKAMEDNPLVEVIING
tara:strand:+ start:156 stop:266 length:111 start_codon:yes stop_codon:yes gene_type:complete